MSNGILLYAENGSIQFPQEFVNRTEACETMQREYDKVIAKEKELKITRKKIPSSIHLEQKNTKQGVQQGVAWIRTDDCYMRWEA
jgi:hypothetical protein